MNPGSILVSVATIILLACAGCSGGNDDRDITQDVTVADVVEDTREDAGWPLHSVTSATPLVESAILTDSHHGWKGANCSKCHMPDHGGTNPPECAVCHGSNGAGNQPIGHATGNCAACHGSVHAEVKPAFVGPGDCAACHRFQDAGVCPLVEDYDAVVIGAGGGGLGAAATLARAGMKVALVERHNKVGGYMTNFVRGDFRFEVSLHAMGGFDEGNQGTRKMFEKLGIIDDVIPVKADAMYRTYYPDGETFETPDGLMA